MSYATGAATSPIDALQKLVTFLVAAGWTQDMSQAEGVGWRAHLHKSGNYAHLRAAMSEQPWAASNDANNYTLNLYTGSAFSAGQPWNNQVTGAPIASGTGYPVGVGMPLSAGPFTNYHFFSDAAGDNIVVVIEQSSGIFKHFGWGLSLNKAGSYTGGAYIFGVASGKHASSTSFLNYSGYDLTADCPGVDQDPIDGTCTFVRADVDSFTGKWIGCSSSTDPLSGYTGKVGNSSVAPSQIYGGMRAEFPVYAYAQEFSGVAYEFQNLQTSRQDQRANLLPILLWVLRDGTTTGFSLLGDVPNVYVANATRNGYAPASDYLLGSDTYKLFPNFAVKKVP